MGQATMEHLMHSVILGVVLYFAMTMLLKQSKEMACARSSVIAAAAFIYMIMYGHKFPPGQLNPALGF